MRNEELKVESEMEKVGEMDKKIQDLIAKLQTTNAWHNFDIQIIE